MKNILLFLLLSASTLSIFAAKSAGRLQTFRQSDGTQISVRLLGDEHFSWYQTADGALLVRVKKDFHIARTESNGELVSTGILAHNAAGRSEKELQAVNQQDRQMFFNSNAERQRARRQHKVIGGYPASHFCPHSGTVRVPIILMNYTDTIFTFSDKETWNEYFNSDSTIAYTKNTRFKGYGSVKKYFSDASHGKLNFEFDIYGPYTTDHEHDYYGRNKGLSRELELLKEAVRKADADIDFSQYDADNNGKVDMVYIVHAGTGANLSGDENDFWSGSWYTSGSYCTADGQEINILGGTNELAINAAQNDGTALRAGIGVTCHEMSHCLGLPDLYYTLSTTPTDEYGYEDPNNCGPEDWDLMDGGENLYNAMWPCQYAAWEREILGWIDVEELTTPQTVTLFPLNKEGGKACRVTNPANSNEYYIIENYQFDEWNYYINNKVGSGLMITHLNSSNNGFSMTPNNTYGKPNITILPADGFILALYSSGATISYKGSVVTMPENSSDFKKQYYYPDAQGDPYVGSKCANPVTAVAAYKNYTGEDMVNKYPITNITRNEDGSISFDFMMDDTQTAINTIATNTNTNCIYTLDGRMIGTDTSSLSPGIYIRNGQKFVK